MSVILSDISARLIGQRGRLLRASLRSTVAVLAVCSVLAGCQQVKDTAGGLLTQLSDLFDDGYVAGDDVCRPQRQAMADSSMSLIKQDEIMKTALTAIMTGDLRSSIASSVNSLAKGYLTRMIKEGVSANQVTDTVSMDVRANNAKIDKIITAFKALDTCRKGEVGRIRSDLAAKHIDRNTAETRMGEARNKRQQDVAKFKQLTETISKGSATYAATYNEIAADNGLRGFDIDDTSGRIAQSRSVAKKKVTDPGTLGGANHTKVTQLQRDCLTNVRKRDDCFELVAKAEEGPDDFRI